MELLFGDYVARFGLSIADYSSMMRVCRGAYDGGFTARGHALYHHGRPVVTYEWATVVLAIRIFDTIAGTTYPMFCGGPGSTVVVNPVNARTSVVCCGLVRRFLRKFLQAPLFCIQYMGTQLLVHTELDPLRPAILGDHKFSVTFEFIAHHKVTYSDGILVILCGRRRLRLVRHRGPVEKKPYYSLYGALFTGPPYIHSWTPLNDQIVNLIPE